MVQSEFSLPPGVHGTSRGTLDDSDDSDDPDVDYSLWDADAETWSFYEEYGEELEEQYQWERRKRAAN